MNRKVTVSAARATSARRSPAASPTKQLADVVVIDIADQKAAGVALDILEACPVYGSDARVIGTGDYAESANSDVVVITSGVPRKPGMSRDDLLNVNYKIMQQVTEQVVKYSPNCIIIPVSNPLDAMAQAVLKLSKFPRERVIGMAGVLDSARMRTFIAMELNVSVENVHAFVLGGHGDTMVPLPRYSTVAGIPITELMDKATDRRDRARTARRRPGDHRSWSAPAPGTRRARRWWRWSRRSCSTRRRSCRARCSCRASTASATCSSACRASSARAASSRSSRSS